MAGGQKRRAQRSEAIGKLAERILTFPDGKFEPSPPPQLLCKLTDEDLVVAVDAVEAVVAKQHPRPSGRAQFRLLAWTVADARGAATPLEKALAETVGKRLDRQAQKVRGDIELCEREYHERRLYASEAEHASMDAAHRLAMEALRTEVYVGFHELEPAGEEEAAVAALPATLAAALQIAEAPRHPSQPLPDIPPDLCRSLGSAGVQYLWDLAIEIDWANPGYFRPHARKSEDWHQLVPQAMTKLLRGAAEIPRLQSEIEESQDELETMWKLVEAKEKQVELLEKANGLLRDKVRRQAEALGPSDPCAEDDL
jgi:hypothetical protein